MTWNDFLESFQRLWDYVIPFASGLTNTFSTPLRDIVNDAPVFTSWILNLLPDSILSMTLLSVLCSALIPVACVVFIAKVLIDW